MRLQQAAAIAPIHEHSFPHQPTLRETAVADYDQIAALLARNGLRARTYREWERLWQENPAYESFPTHWPIGWVLESDGRIVGSIGNVCSTYFWNGHRIWAATECDWAVDEEYRAYSLVLLQRLTNQPNVDLLITTTAGANAEPSYAALRWSRVPAGQWDRAAFWVTGYHGFADYALRTRMGRLRMPVLRYPLSTALAWRDRYFRRGNGGGHQVTVEQCADFDGRFDAFWEELKKRKRNVLVADRSRAALSWHLRPGAGTTWIATVLNGSKLTAYGIFVRRDNADVGLKRVRLVDFQSIGQPEEALRGILSWGLDRCRAEAIHVLEDVGCLIQHSGVPGLKAPYERPLDSWVYYYKAKGRELSDALRHSPNWEPSSYDGDASLQ